MVLKKIVSGGQTGVDRGALDAAIALGIKHGGWCPPRRRAEDRRIPDRYKLSEVPEEDFAPRGCNFHEIRDHYRLRTALNVEDSEATLILTPDPSQLSAGTRLTLNLVREASKPCLVLSLADVDASWRVRTWVRDQGVRVLNVAGPRESKFPGVQSQVRDLLLAAFREERDG